MGKVEDKNTRLRKLKILNKKIKEHPAKFNYSAEKIRNVNREI